MVYHAEAQDSLIIGFMTPINARLRRNANCKTLNLLNQQPRNGGLFLTLTTMAGERIKELLPSDIEDVRILIEGGVSKVVECTTELDEPLPYSRMSYTFPIRQYPPRYNIVAERIFEFGDDAQRVVSLLALANGMTHHSKMNQPDTDKMVKVKKMIDTMLMSVELVLKQ